MFKLNDIVYSLKRYENMDGNYTQISNDVYKMTNGNEFKIYSYLCMRYNKNCQYAFPSIRTIALDCNMSTKTVQKCIARLEEIKLIKILKFTEKTSMYANNMYRIYYPIIIKNSIEDEERRKIQEELDKLIEEADNEIVGSVQTIEIEKDDENE
jgi:DNA-binding transcriptional regulator YhcF (GntR family)